MLTVTLVLAGTTLAADAESGEAVIFASQFGAEGSGDGDFATPGGVAADAESDLWVLDVGNDRVEEFDESGSYIRQFGSAGRRLGQLEEPDALTVDAEGNVWVADAGNDRIEEFDRYGTFVKVIGSGEVEAPAGVAVDHDGDVWVSDAARGQLLVFDPDGELVRTVGSQGTEPGQLAEPLGIAIDASGHVWVVDGSADRVVEFDESGAYLGEFGSGGSESGELTKPDGIGVDAEGHIWLAEPGNDRVQEFTERGEYVRQFGSPGWELGQFGIDRPTGIVVTASQHVWVADTDNDRVQEWAPGVPTGPSFTGDPKIDGELEQSATLAADPGGLSGTPPFEYAYQWQRCDESACADIESATEREYQLGEADVGHLMRVLVTATNPAGSAQAVSTETGSVAPLASPRVSENPSISGDAEGGATLYTNGGVWQGSPVSYAYQWQRCDQAGEECANIESATEPEYTLGSADAGKTIRVLVTASNEAGASDPATSAATPVIDGPPPADVQAPRITGTPSTLESLSANAGSWSGRAPLSHSYQWLRCDATGGECTDQSGASETTLQLDEGDAGATFRVRVTAANDAGSASVTSSATAPVTSSSTPEQEVVPSIGGTALVGQTLTAAAGRWAATPQPSYSYQWQSCADGGESCTDITGATSASYVVQPGDLERRLRVVVTASNVAGSAQGVTAPTEAVESGPPSELRAPSIEGAGQVGETLRADAGEWGGAGIEFSYQWQRCDGEGTECHDVVGATTAEYTTGGEDLEHLLRVEIGARDALGAVVARSAPTAAISSQTLLNTRTPAIEGVASVGGTLTVSVGGWLGEESIGYGYQWQRCHLDGSHCTEIDGAAEASYQPTSADGGEILRALVTAEEEGGAADVASAISPPIAAAGAPVNVAAPTVAGTPVVGQALAVSAGEWSGGPWVLAYRWERCDELGRECEPISGATASVYTPVADDGGQTARALVSASDSEGHSTSAISPPVAIDPSTLQRLSDPSISGAGRVGATLTAAPGLWSGIGAIEFAYQWERCSGAGAECTPIEGADALSYELTTADAEHALRVRVTTHAGGEEAEALSAATPAIVAAPVAPEARVAPSIAGYETEGETLTAQTGTWFSSEAIAYAYQWQRCDAEGEGCEAIEGATEQDFTLAAADVGHTLRVIVTATNSLGSAEASSQRTEAVERPSAPVDGTVPSIRGTAHEGARLTVENGVWSGSRPLSFYYEWERCDEAGEECAAIEHATTPSYVIGASDLDHRLRVLVSSRNGAGEASVLSSPTVTVAGRESASAVEAVEVAERTDPSVLAASTSTSIEGQSAEPGLSDPGEELEASSALTSSDVSKETPGELALGTPGGEVSFAPTEIAPGASTMPVIANGAAAVFANTAAATDTFVRPDALGATALLQLRSAEAPDSFSWEVGLGADQELELLSDGSVAVIEEGATSLESPISLEQEQGPAAESPEETEGEEGFGSGAAEESLEASVGEEGALGALESAPHVDTGTVTPASGELHPQDTTAQYEHASSSLAYAEAHAAGTVLMVIQAPTVLDADGQTVAAHLTVDDDEVTLHLSPGDGATYPLTAAESVAAPTDRATAASAHSVQYGLSDPNASVFSSLDPALSTPASHLHLHVARDVIAFDAGDHPEKLAHVVSWLQAVGKAGLAPYLTLSTQESGGHEFCNVGESCPAPSVAHYQSALADLVNGLNSAQEHEREHHEQVIPSVHLWGAWNEPDLNMNKEVERDPLYDKPGLAARYWEVAQSMIRCSACRVVAGEFAEDSDDAHQRYIREYLTHIVRDHYHRAGKPRNVGFHDYHDLVHVPETLSGYANSAARTFTTLVKHRFGGHAHILFSEQGVELQDGGESTRIYGSLRRQELAAEDFLKLADVSRNVGVVDYYLYRGPTAGQRNEHPHAFDSALRDGVLSPPSDLRPAYCYLVLNRRGCPAGATTGAPVAKSTTTSSSVVLGTIVPSGLPTEYWLDWGLTHTYGHETAHVASSQPEAAETASLALTELQPCTVYHYRVVAANEANGGVPSYGEEHTVKTECEPGGLPPRFTLTKSSVPAREPFAGEPTTIVEVTANAPSVYVEELRSANLSGPPLPTPPYWPWTGTFGSRRERVGEVSPQCYSPGDLVAAVELIARTEFGTATTGWIPTHSIECAPE